MISIEDDCQNDEETVKRNTRSARMRKPVSR